ncbi:hypothetical protein VCHC33A2_0361, partial [Vibrio cholerae HC-33A2]
MVARRAHNPKVV